MEQHQALDENIDTQFVATLSDELTTLKSEYEELREMYKVTEGRLTRAEKLIEDQKEQILQLEARSMRDNLVFYNITEYPGENTEKVLRDFLYKDMYISDEDYSKIYFDRVHRIGQKRDNYARPIVAKFNPYVGKEIVLANTKNLDPRMKYGVSEQLPRELEERKKQLLPLYRDAKKNNQRAKWIRDKLIINGQVSEVKRDKVTDVNMNTTDTAIQLQGATKHSTLKTYKKSSFVGHYVPVNHQDNIVPAIHSVFSDSRYARATHNMYAYRINHGGNVTEHYEDDGEHGGGRALLTMLRDKGVDNAFVCVTRWYGGTHLGKARFDYIKEAAAEALGAST